MLVNPISMSLHPENAGFSVQPKTSNPLVSDTRSLSSFDRMPSLKGRDGGDEKKKDLDDWPMILIERRLEAGRKRIERFFEVDMRRVQSCSAYRNSLSWATVMLT
jgi:hypothetical protein